MKKCITCKKQKPAENFHHNKREKDGRQRYCKECVSQYRRKNKKRIDEYHQKYKQKNKERIKEVNHQYKQKHREEANEYARQHRYDRYGMTQKEYNKIFEQQNGVCAICNQAETFGQYGKLIPLAVDHNHETDKIRGLLCRNCNLGIGYFNDSPELLKEVINYLEEI